MFDENNDAIFSISIDKRHSQLAIGVKFCLGYNGCAGDNVFVNCEYVDLDMGVSMDEDDNLIFKLNGKEYSEDELTSEFSPIYSNELANKMDFKAEIEL